MQFNLMQVSQYLILLLQAMLRGLGHELELFSNKTTTAIDKVKTFLYIHIMFGFFLLLSR